MLSLGKKKVFPIALIYILYVRSITDCFPERTLSSGTGKGSALFHVGFILANLPPLPGCAIKAAAVNPQTLINYVQLRPLKANIGLNLGLLEGKAFNTS